MREVPVGTAVFHRLIHRNGTVALRRDNWRERPGGK
jgi:hypothetical protein